MSSDESTDITTKKRRNPLVTRLNFYQKNFIAACFEENFDCEKDWKKIWDQISENSFARVDQFGTLLMQECLKNDNFTLARSYMDFLKAQNEPLNYVAHIAYLELLARNYADIGDNLFQKTYKEFLNHEPLMDVIRQELISSLSQAQYLDEAIHHWTILQENCSFELVLAKALNAIISALARSKGFEHAYKYVTILEKKCDSSETTNEPYLQQETVIALLQSIQKTKSHESVNHQRSLTLRALQRFKVKFDQDVAKSLYSMLPSSWKLQEATITERTPCQSCGAHLSPVSLSLPDFNNLRNEVLQKVIKGADIYHSTTPEEWKFFVRYLNDLAPFDVVVDGLNIYYCRGDNFFKGRNWGNERLWNPHRNFEDLVQTFPNAKVLVVCRDHMRKWVKRRLTLHRNLYFYYLDWSTNDDVFAIYAAIHSGINCKVVTKDYLRQHKYRLQDRNLMKTFLLWQKMNQILFTWTPQKVVFAETCMYEPVAQWSNAKKSWHLPLIPEEKEDYMEVGKLWLCVQTKT